MEHTIYASYKFTDDQVANLAGQGTSIVRDYVDKLESYLDASNHIHKGEYSGEGLSHLEEEDEWIPWEISFSLRTTERKRPNGDTYTGNPNAMLAVILQDANGSYDYYLQRSTCCVEGCTIHHNHMIFAIMRDNMFNRKSDDKRICDVRSTIWRGEHSYIRSIRWGDFIQDPETYITAAYERQKHIEDYDIHIKVT